MSYDILNRWTSAVIYHSDTATTAKECVERANLEGADLEGANLNWANLNRANLGDLKIIQVGGSKHWIVALLTPVGCEVRIGCQHHPLAWWLEHYAAIGRTEGYTDAQAAEYGRHLAYVAEWAGGAA